MHNPPRTYKADKNFKEERVSMKKIVSAIITLAMIASMFTALPLAAKADGGVGEAYTEPESPSVTYNMNLDWKFKETVDGMGKSATAAWESVAAGGKQFYDVGYDDSSWETVSIPHGINGEDAFTSNTKDAGGGMGRLGVFLYRKTFTVPTLPTDGKVFFELEGIRQAAFVWVNGEPVGYYEAGIAPMGFDITKFVKSGETALIAIANDCSATSGNSKRFAYETVPGDAWASSYTPNNFTTSIGDTNGSGKIGTGYQWNVRSFNETQAGLVYDAYLHVTGGVYQTLPLYNNLKTTGNYIYADNFEDCRTGKATINVDAEVRNESGAAGEYTLQVDVVDNKGNLAYTFESEKTNVAAATDKGVVFETAVEGSVNPDKSLSEDNVYNQKNIDNPVGITKVNTPEVTHIKASYAADGLRLWTDTDPYLYTVYTILKDSTGKVVDVQKKDTGFRKVSYDPQQGVLINDKPVWLKGYAQRSTNEWAVIGVAPDWLQDYDMALLKENNANFIRWMHVTPKPPEVRSSDRYGVIVVCPAGDKEGDAEGRAWSQRVEAMRDAMIYFRNSPSVLFYETGNSPVSAAHANEMAQLRNTIDPYGMRFIGARSTQLANQINYDGNYAGTMYGNYASNAKNAMTTNGKPGPIMETEYAREESPRRVWDDYSPPDYDYVNKALHGTSKMDGYDAHDQTQESITVSNIREYNGYYSNRVGQGQSLYSAEAMMVWSDSNMHGRNSASENCRTSGRVDPVRQTKEMFEGTRVAHSDTPAVHIVGHWSYPQESDDTYNYFNTREVDLGTDKNGNRIWYDDYTTEKLKRDPKTKTVYVIGSKDVSKVELYRVDGDKETLIGTDDSADSTFIYQFDNIDVTQGDAVIAKAYDVNGDEIKEATDKKVRTGDPVEIRLTPHTAVKTDDEGKTVSDWRADGSDIAYIDVEVVDKDGNVCVLNYDKINFEYSGNGTYLGGYNSGTGAGCFQNSSGTISKYFKGLTPDTSTIRKDYVYAENGTNRIFVKSTRNAGDFTLTAKMDIAGMMPASVTITSVAAPTENGLTEVMSAHLKPGLSANAPVSSNVNPMQALIKAFDVDWANVKIEKEVDTNVYYDTYVGSEKLTLADNIRSRKGTPSGIYSPAKPILDKLGIQNEITTDTDGVHTLKITVGSDYYTIKEGENQLYKNGNMNDSNETVQGASVIDGEFFVHSIVFSYIGVGVQQDDENKTVTYTKAQ